MHLCVQICVGDNPGLLFYINHSSWLLFCFYSKERSLSNLLSDRVDQLFKETQGSCCFCFPSTRFISVHHHTRIDAINMNS